MYELCMWLLVTTGILLVLGSLTNSMELVGIGACVGALFVSVYAFWRWSE